MFIAMLVEVRKLIYEQIISTKRQKIFKSMKKITELKNVITELGKKSNRRIQ